MTVHADRIVLTQDFREGTFCCKSAVAIGIVGRNGKPQVLNQTELRLSIPASTNPFTVLIGSAATFDPNEDVAASALRQVDAAATAGYSRMSQETRTWWHQFWRAASSMNSATA